MILKFSLFSVKTWLSGDIERVFLQEAYDDGNSFYSQPPHPKSFQIPCMRSIE